MWIVLIKPPVYGIKPDQEPSRNTFFNGPDRIYVDSDANLVPLRFTTSQEALNHALKKWGSDYATIAEVPEIIGDSISGFDAVMG